ncbi:hypothetical protein C8J56DRAFT_327305 [Mycena floridula]|nr:hypothetical protein C8J56DRAFT_327305 [Mycena floridula]
MSSPYDQSLLAAAPVATKAQLQEGYNADLLAPPTRRPTNPENGVPSNEKVVPALPRVPFWRTTKGLIIIGVAAVVIVVAIVVGAVVGSKHKAKSTATTPNSEPGIIASAASGDTAGILTATGATASASSTPSPQPCTGEDCHS